MDLAAIEDAFRDPTDAHEPLTGLITIENTHAHSMGQPLTPAYTRQVAEIATRHGVPLHVDGARFWDAVVSQREAGVTAIDLAGPADSVTFCLSKGLGCPVGSMVVGLDRLHPPGPSRRASSSAAGCARRGSWPRPAWSPCPTARTG